MQEPVASVQQPPPSPKAAPAFYEYPIPVGVVALLLAGAGAWWLRLWNQGRADAKEIARLNAALTVSAETRNALAEKVRVEKEAELTAARKQYADLEASVKAELQAALDEAHARLNRRPPYPPEPPPGIVRKKHSTRELLGQLVEVTGRYRREDLINDATQDV